MGFTTNFPRQLTGSDFWRVASPIPFISSAIQVDEEMTATDRFGPVQKLLPYRCSGLGQDFYVIFFRIE